MYEILNNTREGTAVEFPGSPEEAGVYHRVGTWFRRINPETNSWEDYKQITSIRVSCDLPGLHCNMDRLTIWADEELLLEAPLHSVTYVTYK